VALPRFLYRTVTAAWVVSAAESTSFFAKKEAKKLLFAGGCVANRADAGNWQKFLLLFLKTTQ
jgi:hypothetical protein